MLLNILGFFNFLKTIKMIKIRVNLVAIPRKAEEKLDVSSVDGPAHSGGEHEESAYTHAPNDK
jgi:hypothetical protein